MVRKFNMYPTTRSCACVIYLHIKRFIYLKNIWLIGIWGYTPINCSNNYMWFEPKSHNLRVILQIWTLWPQITSKSLKGPKYNLNANFVLYVWFHIKTWTQLVYEALLQSYYPTWSLHDLGCLHKLRVLLHPIPAPHSLSPP